MKYCHVCNKEFDDENVFCPVCDEPLLDAPFSDVNTGVPVEFTEDEELAVLFSAINDREADVIVSLLKSEGIPAMLNLREAGLYLTVYMGFCRFGTDIIVRKRDYAAALEVLKEAETDV